MTVGVRYDDTFDPARASRDEIMSRANALRGLRLREIVVRFGRTAERSRFDKGMVGQLVERYFNIRQNSDSQPDFLEAGVELKVVPLKEISRPKRAFKVKERTSITMINYGTLLNEQWSTASVRGKCESILFVYYHHIPHADVLDYPIVEVMEWSPQADLTAQLERDWTVVHAKVRRGRAHQISERDGKVLGAATKGQGGVTVSQPRSPTPAKPRAWALKPSLTTWLFEDHRGKLKQVSIREALGLSVTDEFEAAALARLKPSVGESIKDLAATLRIPFGGGKANVAIFVRRLLGLVNDRARVREFEQQGILVKTVPLSPDGRQIYESMSFARFDHMKVIDETWDESDLRLHLQRLLVVPIVRRVRSEPRALNRLGTPFFWSPTDSELEGIGREWTTFVELIRNGQADALPTAAETKFIHVRPKGRDGSDHEPAPGLPSVMKKSFWLNSEFVQGVISANLPGGVLS